MVNRRCGVAPCAPDTLERLIGLQVWGERMINGRAEERGGGREGGRKDGEREAWGGARAPDAMERLFGLQVCV